MFMLFKHIFTFKYFLGAIVFVLSIGLLQFFIIDQSLQEDPSWIDKKVFFFDTSIGVVITSDINEVNIDKKIANVAMRKVLIAYFLRKSRQNYSNALKFALNNKELSELHNDFFKKLPPLNIVHLASYKKKKSVYSLWIINDAEIMVIKNNLERYLTPIILKKIYKETQ